VYYLSVVCYNKIIVVVSIIVVLIILLALSHAHHAIGMHHVMHQNLLKTSVKSIGKSAKKANCLDRRTCCPTKFP